LSLFFGTIILCTEKLRKIKASEPVGSLGQLQPQTHASKEINKNKTKPSVKGYQYISISNILLLCTTKTIIKQNGNST
jgi:hypothetical protein